MPTFLYIILVAVCTFFVYNIFDKLKRICVVEEFQSGLLKFIFLTLLGFILAGIIIFFLKFIALPLILIGLIYFVIKK